MTGFAATRDRAFYASRPSERYIPKYHVVARFSSSDLPYSDCRVQLLAAGTEIQATDVPTDRRCQLPGCRGRWPEATP